MSQRTIETRTTDSMRKRFESGEVTTSKQERKQIACYQGATIDDEVVRPLPSKVERPRVKAGGAGRNLVDFLIHTVGDRPSVIGSSPPPGTHPAREHASLHLWHLTDERDAVKWYT